MASFEAKLVLIVQSVEIRIKVRCDRFHGKWWVFYTIHTQAKLQSTILFEYFVVLFMITE